MADAIRPSLPRAAGQRLRRDPRSIAAAVLLIIVALGAVMLFRPHQRVDARQALIDSLVTLKAGNYSAARNHAQAAVRAAPQSGMAHAILARAYLQLGEGLAAEAELTRARDVGMPIDRLHQLLAQAAFLQGNYVGAIKEAAKTPAHYGDFALRVTARALAMQGDSAQATTLLSGLTDRVPNDADAWTDLGRVRLSAGEIGEAGSAAARAIALSPGDPIALTLQGEVVRTRYGVVASLPWFEAALKHDAYYHPALIEYAASLGEAGRYADMLAMTRRAQAARPGSPQAFYLQSVLAARAGNTELARDLLGKTGGVVDDLPGAILLSGSLDYAQGKYEQAIAMWRRVVAAQPMNVMARRLLGAALLRSGDPQSALDGLRPIAMRDDADSYALLLVGRAFEATGDRVSAARFFDRAAVGNRGIAPVFASDDSVATLAADADAAPTDPNYVLGVIRAQLGTGDLAGAMTRARSLSVASPGAPATHLALGDTLVAAGRYGDAAAAYARAADLSFDEPTMLRLVDSLGRAGRVLDAASALALYLSQNPQSLSGQRLLGHWQIVGGMPSAAIETLEGVRRRIGNRDADLLADLARAYAGVQDGDVARRYAQAAYALAPMNAQIADAYGVALAAAGDVDGARQLLAKAATLAPSDPAIADHRRQING